MFRQDPFVTGEYYHIYNRGVDKRIIFKSNKDYERFIILLYLANSTDSFKLDDLVHKQHKIFNEILLLGRGESLVSIGAWCLMPNHFHILVRQEADGGITKFMRKLGVGYSMYFNIKYQRAGALFGGLFKSKLIGNDDRYMKHLFGYIHLNPIEINFPNWEEKINKNSNGMNNFLKNYRYSSYQDYTGADRTENNIIKRENFPDYFNEGMSFHDFVKDYLVGDSLEP